LWSKSEQQWEPGFHCGFDDLAEFKFNFDGVGFGNDFDEHYGLNAGWQPSARSGAGAER
jgi:hypothetical protein